MTPTFFTDRDLGREFPALLRGAGLAIEAHSDHFDQACPDEEWLSFVGGKEWFAISRDQKIRYRPNEKEAVVRNRVGLFLIVGKSKHDVLAGNFIRTLSSILRVAATLQRPFIARVVRPFPQELKRDPMAPGHVTPVRLK